MPRLTLKEFVQSIREDTSPQVAGIDGRIRVVVGMAAKNPTWNIDSFA